MVAGRPLSHTAHLAPRPEGARPLVEARDQRLYLLLTAHSVMVNYVAALHTEKLWMAISGEQIGGSSVHLCSQGDGSWQRGGRASWGWSPPAVGREGLMQAPTSGTNSDAGGG